MFQTVNKKGDYEHLVGCTIRILQMEGESMYTNKIGIVEFVDDIGQLHGTWGGCAIIPGVDDYEIIKKG